jgi:Formin Homology 2 Domain
LKENLPTEEERKGLMEYMKGTGLSEDEKRAAYVQLSECEKYMLTMIEVENAAAKFDCMLYRVQFKPRLTEILDSIRTVETACNEVRSSEKLREIMAMILTLVNEINTGGDGKLAVGFSLDALLKLNEVRACVINHGAFEIF